MNYKQSIEIKSFEVGKFYNYYILSRTSKQIKISRSNDDNSCVGFHSIYKYKDSEFICSKVKYLSGLVYDDTYYHRIFYCGKIQRVIISTVDFFSTLSDDDLVSLYKSKFDFSILDSSSTEIVPVEPVQDEPIIEVVESPQDIHQRICTNFDIVEKTLYEICVDLKTIRDNKYYKQLGYDTFEAYCLENFNLKRTQYSSYLSIAENLSSDFVRSSEHLGVKKLYCLSRLTDEERTELVESTDIEHTPVKQVEQKAKEIKKNREVNSIWNGSSSSNVLDSKIKDDDNSSTYQSSSMEKEFVAKYGKEMNALFLVIRGNLKKLSKDFDSYICHLDSCYSFLNYTDLSKNFGFNGLFSVDSFFKDVDFNKFINTVKALSMWVDNYKCISLGKCTPFDVNDIKDVLCGLSDGDDKNGN